MGNERPLDGENVQATGIDVYPPAAPLARPSGAFQRVTDVLVRIRALLGASAVASAENSGTEER